MRMNVYVRVCADMEGCVRHGRMKCHGHKSNVPDDTPAVQKSKDVKTWLDEKVKFEFNFVLIYIVPQIVSHHVRPSSEDCRGDHR